MKNSRIISILMLSFFAVFAVSAINAQSQTVNMPEGFSIVFENKIMPKPSENDSQKIKTINVLSSILGVNTVHRIFADREDKVHFGYDIEVKKNGGTYIVTFKALSVSLFVTDSKAKKIPKYPEPLGISEGDTISINLLENPKTKVKIVDLIKIILTDPNLPENKANQIVIAIPDISESPILTTRIITSKDSKPKDLAVDELKMQSFNTKLAVNGTQIFADKSAIGSNIYFYLKGKGRFILSPFPRAGFDFQKIGIIDDNKISFTMNGDNYEISSATPIMCFGGKWNLWVLYEPNYRPKLEDITEEFGADKIESLVK
jgi:hypothetical protein